MLITNHELFAGFCVISSLSIGLTGLFAICGWFGDFEHESGWISKFYIAYAEYLENIKLSDIKGLLLCVWVFAAFYTSAACGIVVMIGLACWFYVYRQLRLMYANYMISIAVKTHMLDIIDRF